MQQETLFDQDIEQARQFQNIFAITQRCNSLLKQISPTDKNFQDRYRIFKSLCHDILQQIPDAILVPYGSFASKCYLFNSDVDFCCWVPG